MHAAKQLMSDNKDKSQPAKGPRRAGSRSSTCSVVDEKERVIIEAARRVFLANGFDGASMDAIAQTASVSKRTVYNRFASKEALFAATIEETCRRLLPVDIPNLENAGSSRAFIEDFARIFLRGILEPEAVALRRIATFEAHRKPSLGIAFLEHGPEFMVAACGPILNKVAQSAGLAIDDPTKAIWRLAALITEPLHTKVLLGRTPENLDAEIDRQVENALDAFWKIYGAP